MESLKLNLYFIPQILRAFNWAQVVSSGIVTQAKVFLDLNNKK